MSNEHILQSTLDIMPQNFSSNKFCNEALKKGIDKYLINNGFCLTFLRKNAVQSNQSKRLWSKKNNITIDLQTAIKIVKEAGYRILKPKQEWEEL